MSLAPLLAQLVKNLPVNAGDTRDEVQYLDWEDSLEMEIATHSSILAWEIPWTEQPDRLQSKRSQRIGHDLTINIFTFCKST